MSYGRTDYDSTKFSKSYNVPVYAACLHVDTKPVHREFTQLQHYVSVLIAISKKGVCILVHV
jgi:hypothetical protein